MHGTGRPPLLTDREVTERTIALVYRRARAAQRALGPSAGPPGASGRTEESEGDQPLPMDGDGGQERGSDLDRDPLEGEVDPVDQALPHPVVTDANLRFHLGEASRLMGSPDASGPRAIADALRPDRRAAFNAAVVHAFHQLDHRTRLQEHLIAGLEAELAETRRALAAIEAELAAARATEP